MENKANGSRGCVPLIPSYAVHYPPNLENCVAKLSIAHILLLLILDDESGKPLVSDATKVLFALAGAALIELQFSGRLVAVKANRFGIVDEPKRTDGLEWAAQ